MCLQTKIVKWLVAGFILPFALVSVALADGIDGTWRLVKRQLPDGTVLTPPAVVGLGTTGHGLRHLNVFWHTPEGNPASFGIISKVNLTGYKYTETLIASAFDDGSGNPVVFDFSGETRSANVMREGGRISYQLPFDPPSVVYDGDTLTATLEGAFVDYWERLK